MNQFATERTGPVNGRVRSRVSAAPLPSENLTVAVAAISHNYGRFLSQALHSIKDQSHPVAEIVVIDDSSTDNTREIAGNHNVPYHRIDRGHQYCGMAKAMDVTSSDILCFLDADDLIPSDYVSAGLPLFREYDVGVVYSDMKKFGTDKGIVSFGEFESSNVHKDNFMHAGSLVRRESLVSSRALSKGMPLGMESATDWYVWRSVLLEGWKAAKQPAQYLYRQHGKNNSHKYRDDAFDYFTRACLVSEPVSFFIPLSGRQRYWKRMARFLDNQKWPRDLTSVYLLDTSRSKRFHKRLKKWAFKCDYDDVRIVRFDPGERAGVADEDRRDDTVRHSVQRAVARIYNKMAKDISTEYVLTIEDDVLPPLDVARQLLSGFSPSTVSVAAPLESRYHEGFLHWYLPKEICIKRGVGVEEIGGSGFGCTMLRGSVLKDTVFTSNPAFCNGDFDGSFFARLPQWKKKVNWDCYCQHGQ